MCAAIHRQTEGMTKRVTEGMTKGMTALAQHKSSKLRKCSAFTVVNSKS